MVLYSEYLQHNYTDAFLNSIKTRIQQHYEPYIKSWVSTSQRTVRVHYKDKTEKKMIFGEIIGFLFCRILRNT